MAYVVHGVAVSSGVAVGRAFLLHAEPLPIVPDPIPPERVNAEIEVFHRARADAAEELDVLKGQVQEALGEPYAGIFEAQKLVLEDPNLVDQTVQRIRVGRVSARWACSTYCSAIPETYTRTAPLTCAGSPGARRSARRA